MQRNISLLVEGRLIPFNAAAVLEYGSLENLLASDTLTGVRDREAALASLWEAANLPPIDVEALTRTKAEAQADTNGED